MNFDLRLKTFGVAREAQEHIFWVNDTELSRAKAVEAIHEIAAPESPSPAFSIPMTVETVWEGGEVSVLALLNFHVQPESTGCSNRASTDVPRIIGVVDREVVDSENHPRLNELNAEMTVVACVSRDSSVLNPQSLVFWFRREDRGQCKDRVNEHQVVEWLLAASKNPCLEWSFWEHAVSCLWDMFKEHLHEVRDESGMSCVRIHLPISKEVVVDGASDRSFQPRVGGRACLSSRDSRRCL